jgi:hypothetical protein
MKTKLITDASALDKLSKELAGDIKGMDERIQTYLMSEINHIEAHRNITRLNKFFSVIVGSGARVNAMHNFVQVFANIDLLTTPLEAEENGEKFTIFYQMRKVRKQYRVYIDGKWNQLKDWGAVLDLAESKPWYKFQPERSPRAYVLEDSFANLIKAAIRGLANNHKDTKVPAEFLADIVDLGRKHGMDISKMVPADLNIPDETKKAVHLIVDNTKPSAENPIAGAPAEKPANARKGNAA